MPEIQNDVKEIKKIAMTLKIADDRATYFKKASQFLGKEHLQKLNDRGFTIVPNYDFISMASIHYFITHNIIDNSNDIAHELLKDFSNDINSKT